MSSIKLFDLSPHVYTQKGTGPFWLTNLFPLTE